VELLQKKGSVKGPAERVTGDMWVDMIAEGEPPSRLRVGMARFAPGARAAWHWHAVGQTLHLTEGDHVRVFYQYRPSGSPASSWLVPLLTDSFGWYSMPRTARKMP
jgi:hypothetical protein